MSSRDEHTTTPFPKPIEIKLADVLFLAMRKNLILFKDLGKQHVHYSFFIYGSTIDCHETLEVDHKHIQLLKIEFDWQVLLQKVMQEVRANWRSIFQVVKVSDPEWEDLEVEFIPVQVLVELLSPVVKGARWNVDLGFLKKLDDSLEYARLGELVEGELIIGTGSKRVAEYLVLCNGNDCFLFDTSKMSKIIERNFELSIRKIHLSYFTLSSITFYLKIHLAKLVHSQMTYLRKLMPLQRSSRKQ